MQHTPSYRTYTLRCPTNKGKLEAVESWVYLWRELAELERDYQISRFRFTEGKHGLETSASKGWTRPWVSDGRCSTTMAQQIMAQVSSQLQGHIGILKNAVQALIGDQAKTSGWTADERHRLYSLNRHGLWWARSGVKSPIKGEVSLSRTNLRQGRKLLLQALRQHRFPSFANYHPQLDQRNCAIEFARNSRSIFPLWARVSPSCKGQGINLPLVGWKQLMEAVVTTSAALAPGQAERLAIKRERQAKKRQAAGKPPVDTAKQRSLKPTRAALPHTLRLILTAAGGQNSGQISTSCNAPNAPSASPPKLQVAIVLDHGAHDSLLRADYVPIPGKTVATDLGLDVLLATSDGDLLGRDWMHQLERYSKVIDVIAAHRQRLGLPVRSARYDAWVTKLDGFMKTNIHRLVNNWVSRVKPERIIISDDCWHQAPGMSKRMNRLASRFGKRHLKAAMQKLESTHGIVIETRPGAYTSKECHRCGYVDARNRVERNRFICKCCNKKSHADVNAAKVSKDRRSVPATGACWPHPRQTLREVVNTFTERNPRPEALENRPIGRADDPRWSNPYFHAWQQHWTPRVEIAEVASRWRKPRSAASIGVSLTGQDARKKAVPVGRPTRNANRANIFNYNHFMI